MADSSVPPARDAYWRANLRWVIGLLAVWFAVSFGAGILLAPALDDTRLPGSGFPLGFWFAQQGAIYVFVLLIFIYVKAMNRLDRRFGVDEEPAPSPRPGEPDRPLVTEDPTGSIPPEDPVL